jgi:hypothetical protein
MVYEETNGKIPAWFILMGIRQNAILARAVVDFPRKFRYDPCWRDSNGPENLLNKVSRITRKALRIGSDTCP